jgi:hypothetical protein
MSSSPAMFLIDQDGCASEMTLDYGARGRMVGIARQRFS